MSTPGKVGLTPRQMLRLGPACGIVPRSLVAPPCPCRPFTYLFRRLLHLLTARFVLFANVEDPRRFRHTGAASRAGYAGVPWATHPPIVQQRSTGGVYGKPPAPWFRGGAGVGVREKYSA